MLTDPSHGRSRIRRASKNIPPDQQAFLAAYESREQEMIDFLKAHKLVTLPPYLGPFQIRQLPEAFKPTSPGGFMNPPGIYDADNGGFFFIPTYNPQSGNFYIRAAIEDPRPILGHEGIPGHFLQISIANHLDERDPPPARRQRVRRRLGAVRRGDADARRAVSGRLRRRRDRCCACRAIAPRASASTSTCTPGAGRSSRRVKYFMDGGGLDREAAEGRGGRRGVDPDAEDQLHHRQVADHAAARPLPRREGRRLPPRRSSTTSCSRTARCRYRS